MFVNVIVLICDGQHLALVDVINSQIFKDLDWDFKLGKITSNRLTCASTKWPIRTFAITGIDTSAWILLIISGSDIRATPPILRISAGTLSRAITATAPASSAIRACSGVTTSYMRVLWVRRKGGGQLRVPFRRFFALRASNVKREASADLSQWGVKG